MTLTLALVALGLSAPAHAYESLRHAGNFGLGLGGGTYGGGLSAKYWLTDQTAVQGTVAGGGQVTDGVGSATLRVNADYLLEMPLLTEAEGLELAWNIGPGAGLNVVSTNGESAIGLGISGVAGLELDLTVIPLDVVLEYRPVIRIGADSFGFELINFGAQVRYYFR